MPRPKGSKNKAPRKITVANNDFEALIAEKTSAKENLTVEIASLEENLANIKADLKANVMGQEFENSMYHFLLLLSNRPKKTRCHVSGQ